jgi:pSer/pThr/pTyr-binding forkhead associated (FHA) protein
MGKEVTIGKDEDNGICIPETTISGRHAAICTANGSFVIEDLGSTNGTLVNGQKIERRVITHGDTFKLGKCEGEFIIY